MPSKSPPSATSQRCNSCFQTKPIEEFRRRNRTGEGRHRTCNCCHSLAEKKRRSLKRQRLNKKQLAKTLTAIKNERSDRQVKVLCGEIASRFGGLDGLVEAWHHCLDTDLERGGYAAFRHIAALVRLLQYNEGNKPNYGAMSDEQLETAIWELGGPLPEWEE